jgi:hypothetical protein
MSGFLENRVVVIAGRCTVRPGGFGIRMEEVARGRWAANWAFAVSERTAAREGYDQGMIEGSFQVAGEFPGCPHCAARSLFVCICGRVGCWDGQRTSVTCGWCRNTGQVGGEVRSLNSSGDR